MKPWRFRALPRIGAVVGVLAFVGCHSAALLAPPPSLRAASANDFAVDVEFAEPLDRNTAQEAGRYIVYPIGNVGAPVAIYSASLIDTLYGRVVRLLLSGGPLPDSAEYSVQVAGVLTAAGKSTGMRVADFRTGLNYGSPLSELFARHCDSCHGSEGGYRTDTYDALFGGGTDGVPNLIAGDPNCLLVRKTRPQNSMFNWGNLSYLDSELIRNWIISYQARP